MPSYRKNDIKTKSIIEGGKDMKTDKMSGRLLSLLISTGFLLTLIVTLSTPAMAADLLMAKPEEVGLSTERLARIKPVMQRYVDQNLVPGTVTLVARKGKVVHLEAVGYRDVINKNEMKTDTIFRIASMTKPITSVAMMMLYEEGHFLLSDPIYKWLPEFKNPKVAVPNDGEDRAKKRYKLIPASAYSHGWLGQ
jgi:CubicO group peptidase (beta-lactamase class C family)